MTGLRMYHPRMKHSAITCLRMRHQTITLALALLVALASGHVLPAAAPASKKALSADDYSRWRSITGAEISGDGNWVTYVLQLTNTVPAEAKPVLHVLNLETSVDVAIPNATGGTFSPDSRWIAYQVDPSPGRPGARGTPLHPMPAPRRVGRRDAEGHPPRRVAPSCAISRPGWCSPGRTFSRSRSLPPQLI